MLKKTSVPEEGIPAVLLNDVYAGPPWSNRITVHSPEVILAIPAYNQPAGESEIAFWIYPTMKNSPWLIHAKGPYGVGVYESDLKKEAPK